MNSSPVVFGQRNKWSLLEKLGEGDAGEVYRVETLLEGKPAILKRPRKGAFSSDALRQAAQIRTEGEVLAALSAYDLNGAEACVTAPALLDQCPQEKGFGEEYFIVTSPAEGFNLQVLAQVARFGLLDALNTSATEVETFYLQRLIEIGRVPRPLLIRILTGTLLYLKQIHGTSSNDNRLIRRNIVWNDVKPDHLFWDPARACLTIIDWGNSQFLESDGVSADRRLSRKDDHQQFIQAMGEFLAETDPELAAELDWPKADTSRDDLGAAVEQLRERLTVMNEEILNQIREVRRDEVDLYESQRPDLTELQASVDLYRRIAALGEQPDFPSGLNLRVRAALQMASEHRFSELERVCAETANFAVSDADKWILLGEIAQIAGDQPAGEGGLDELPFSSALIAGISGDWPTLLWELFAAYGASQLPEWWASVSRSARIIHLQLDEETLTPYTTISRLYYTLQASVLEREAEPEKILPAADGDLANAELDGEPFLKNFNEEVVRKWKAVEPDPPNSGIAYADVESFLEGVEAILPGARQTVESALMQPNAQAEIVLDAWNRKEFELARRALRQILLWDPDRYRLLAGDRVIAKAPEWIGRVRQGPPKDVPFYDFLTEIELAGRNLRSRVGPANWLESILEALKSLRKGTRTADLLLNRPEVLQAIPWLNEYRSREALRLPRSRPLSLERDTIASNRPQLTISGVREGRLGFDRDLSLSDSLDTWTPEARGSSARVYAGLLRSQSGTRVHGAIKLMRHNRVEYALPLFKEEAQILTMMRDVPGITPMLECGFLRPEEGPDLFLDERPASAESLEGEVVRYGVDEVQNFLASLDRYLANDWIPYLALVKRPHEDNLMNYCDAGYTHGWFLPLKESLLLAVQSCEILQSAHDRNIVYRDHKILHYYWDPHVHGVAMIDWNISRREPQGLTDADRQADLVQFGARALHHIITGRPAPGALPLGPNRPEDIDSASSSYAVNWTYDDERLPNRVKEIIEQVLTQGYTLVRDLQADLTEVYERLTATDQGAGEPDGEDTEVSSEAVTESNQS